MRTDEDKARELLANARAIVVFTGAGVSADSGVPTFRGAASDAMWKMFDPQELASMEGFAANPQRCYDWYNLRRAQLATIQPNPAHHAIARLQSRGAVIVTQNIDGLHERVAPPGAVVHRVHGTILQDKCLNETCPHRETIDLNNLPPLRKCPRCGNYLRPAVVWFGEMLPGDVWHAAEMAVAACDVLLVVGTSGEVWPAAGLVHLAQRKRARIIIVNLEPGELDNLASFLFHDRAASVLPQLVD